MEPDDSVPQPRRHSENFSTRKFSQLFRDRFSEEPSPHYVPALTLAVLDDPGAEPDDKQAAVKAALDRHQFIVEFLTDRLSQLQREDSGYASQLPPGSERPSHLPQAEDAIPIMGRNCEGVVSQAPAFGVPTINVAMADDERESIARRVSREETLHLSVLHVIAKILAGIRIAPGCQELADLAGKAFYQFDELLAAQEEFLTGLDARLANWSSETRIADLYLSLLECKAVVQYAGHLTSSEEALDSLLRQQEFRALFKESNFPGPGAGTLVLTVHSPIRGEGGYCVSVSNLVTLPAEWLSAHKSTCQKLAQMTPAAHPDLLQLGKFCQRLPLLFAGKCRSSQSLYAIGKRLLKQQSVIELVDRRRKQRKLFLFTDVLVCVCNRFRVQWHLPRNSALLEDSSTDDKMQKLTDSEGATMLRGITRRGGSESDSISSLNLRRTDSDQRFAILLNSKSERQEWEQLIVSYLIKSGADSPSFSESDLTTLLQAYSGGIQPSDFACGASSDDESGDCLVGALRVTVHKIEGAFRSAGRYRVATELKDLSRRFLRAHATPLCAETTSGHVAFDCAFQLKLNGTETDIRFLVTEHDASNSECLRDLGCLTLHLYKDSLANYKAKCHCLSSPGQKPLLLIISLEYAPRQSTPVFGLPLETLISAEKNMAVVGWSRQPAEGVPMILQALVEKINQCIGEKGLYRVGTAALTLRVAKASIDAGGPGSVQFIGLDALGDVNLMTGLLKLYIKELPEPLLTEKLNEQLQTAAYISDDEILEMIRRVRMPPANASTTRFLLDHLVRVCDNWQANGVTYESMGWALGPTVIRPAGNANVTDLMQHGVVLTRLLQLYKSGRLEF